MKKIERLKQFADDMKPLAKDMVVQSGVIVRETVAKQWSDFKDAFKPRVARVEGQEREHYLNQQATKVANISKVVCGMEFPDWNGLKNRMEHFDEISINFDQSLDSFPSNEDSEFFERTRKYVTEHFGEGVTVFDVLNTLKGQPYKEIAQRPAVIKAMRNLDKKSRKLD